MTNTLGGYRIELMKLVATLILLGLTSVIFCGLTLANMQGDHSMPMNDSAVVTHHISMYENVSTAIFSDVATSFATFLSLLALVIVVTLLQVHELWSPSSRIVPKRKYGTSSSYKLKRWITLFEHSPSFV